LFTFSCLQFFGCKVENGSKLIPTSGASAVRLTRNFKEPPGFLVSSLHAATKEDQWINGIPANANRTTDDYRRQAKDFYTDLRETWERLVEEVLLCSVVERFTSGGKTQSLRDLSVEDADYQVIYAAMSRVSEYSGHDMAAGRQIPVPDQEDMRRDLQNLDQFRVQIHRRKNGTRDRRAALEGPPQGQVA
jgi:hypothetical protein